VTGTLGIAGCSGVFEWLPWVIPEGRRRSAPTLLQRLSFHLREAGPDPSDALFEAALQRAL